MSDYKELNLNRENLNSYVQAFIEQNGLTLDGGQLKEQPKGKRAEFGRAGSDFATVDLYLNKNGTTTIHWMLGKNQPLGQELANHLKATIDPNEFEQVNLALKGITSGDIESILSQACEAGDIECEKLHEDAQKLQVAICNKAHQDRLVITHHRNTRTLQIQGKPLSCYRRIVYLLSELLDIGGLEQVICRKDDGVAEIVRKEMAEDYLKKFFSRSYELLPGLVQRLLISGCCVKLAAPQLPDYSMLVYPDLRALEGVLKEELIGYNMSVADAKNGFGDFFDKAQEGFKLKEDYSNSVAHAGMVKAFNEAYSFFCKHRHGLFHMEEFADGSRTVDTLEKAIGLSKEAYRVIDGLLTARM
ncbi:type II toxin-antitoxin system RnlA family toxin [Cellvibrio sp. UBA7671]|uniref:type II toxin-antitoxin system RnlA family toxin n=1 Tax=Cellvibrio sp. UBA7671 TaxID=1946312 RepID=UPI002F35BADF